MCRSSWLAALGAALLLGLLTLPQGASAADLPRHGDLEPYARAHYDVLVVEHCGLLTPELRRGFELARDALAREGAIDAQAAQDARRLALLAFDREWSNRGLGGSRPWCREDGKRAALAFYGRFIDDRFALPPGTP